MTVSDTMEQDQASWIVLLFHLATLLTATTYLTFRDSGASEGYRQGFSCRSHELTYVKVFRQCFLCNIKNVKNVNSLHFFHTKPFPTRDGL